MSPTQRMKLRVDTLQCAMAAMETGSETTAALRACVSGIWMAERDMEHAINSARRAAIEEERAAWTLDRCMEVVNGAGYTVIGLDYAAPPVAVDIPPPAQTAAAAAMEEARTTIAARATAFAEALAAEPAAPAPSPQGGLVEGVESPAAVDQQTHEAARSGPKCLLCEERAAVVREHWGNTRLTATSLLSKVNLTGGRRPFMGFEALRAAVVRDLGLPGNRQTYAAQIAPAPPPEPEPPPPPVLRWTEPRRTMLRTLWNLGEKTSRIADRLNEMEGAPVDGSLVSAYAIAVLRLPKRGDPRQRPAQPAERDEAEAPAPPPPRTPIPLPPFRAPPPPPEASEDDRRTRAFQMRRAGHAAALITKRTGLGPEVVAALELQAEATARQMLANGMDSDSIEAEAGLPASRIRDIRATMKKGRAA